MDHAAESVLGDGTEALRQAQRELQQLSDELGQGRGTAQNTNELGTNRLDRAGNGQEQQLASNQRGNRQGGQSGDQANEQDDQNGGNRRGQARNGQRGNNGQGQGQQPGQGENQQANAEDNQGQNQGDGQQGQAGSGGNRAGNGRGGQNGRQGQGQADQGGEQQQANANDMPAARGQGGTALDVVIDRLLGLHSTVSEPYLQALYSCRLTVFQNVKLRADEHVEHGWVTLDELASLDLIPYLASILKRGMLSYVKG